MTKLNKFFAASKRRLKVVFYFILAKRGISSYKGKPTINVKSKFNGRTHLGNNTHFNGISITGKGVVYIGDNFHCGLDCLIISDSHDYKNAYRLPYDDKLLTPNTVIEENVWLGSRVIILPGVRIGYGAIVQAGSVVVEDVEPLAIVGGHPAKQFSIRCGQHYDKLKEEK
ncbi:acyltransferase [Salinivibrio sp. MA607]|uniref:acyltransferase n=1 Tax=Salinivibrio sp. MA607 TaxID=1909457 RepID=UPI00098995EB|nr:acyltransferase [Salinivibrio sp. MA607]OOF01864.1 hypothetical protein BZG81_15360 [Salinivibrio sp. MA607]